MRLGPLRATDRVRLAELLAATGAFHDDEIDVALSLFDLSLGGASDDSADYEFLGARDDDERLIGYACFGPTPATDRTYDLYWLAVDPAAQGQGAGRALVAAVQDTLAARGARLIVVETSSRPDYAGARAFYTRSGYEEVARVADFYAAGDDRILLTTRLTTRSAE